MQDSLRLLLLLLHSNDPQQLVMQHFMIREKGALRYEDEDSRPGDHSLLRLPEPHGPQCGINCRRAFCCSGLMNGEERIPEEGELLFRCWYLETTRQCTRPPT